MSKLIVVIGVTGAQGGSVARTFLENPEWRVRGVTRNPSSEAAQTLAAKGVEIVQGDADDKDSLIQAFQGATAIFSNADYFTHMFHAMQPENQPTDRSVLQYAFDREVAQGINIAEAAESPSVLKTLEQFVLSTLPGATEWSNGKYTTVYHFDSKAEIERLTKERCPGVFSRTRTVILGHYVTNWKPFHKLAPVKQADGSFVLARNTPPTFKMPFVVADKDTGPFVKALVGMPPHSRVFVVSEYMTLPDWAETWGRVHGVETTYKQISREELFEGVPEDMATEIGDSFDFIHDIGFPGPDPRVIYPDQLNIKTTSMEECIRGEDWSPIM